MFGTFDVSMLPSEGQWYAGSMESSAECSARAARVVEWLRGAAFDAVVGPERALVALITHGQFISDLICALLSFAGSPEGEQGGDGNPRVKFQTPNTATSLFVLKASGRVSVRWISSTAHLDYAQPLT